MNPRWFTSTTKATAESSLSAITLRFCGFSGFLLFIAAILFALLKGPGKSFAVYTWAVPLGLWVIAVIFLFVGAVRAFANSPDKDSSTALLTWSMSMTILLLLVPWVLRFEDDWVLPLAAMLQILFMTAAVIFVLIAAFTRTRIMTKDTISLLITVYGGLNGCHRIGSLFLPQYFGQTN